MRIALKPSVYLKGNPQGNILAFTKEEGCGNEASVYGLNLWLIYIQRKGTVVKI